MVEDRLGGVVLGICEVRSPAELSEPVTNQTAADLLVGHVDRASPTLSTRIHRMGLRGIATERDPLMIGFVQELDVDLPPSAVFDLLADMAELDRWNPNVRDSRRTGGDRLEPGSHYESTIVRGPLRMTARSELITVEPNRRVQYEGSIALFWSVDSIAIEPSGEGTRITFRNETRTPTWLRPLTGLLNALFQRQARRAVEGASRYLDGR